MSWIALRDKDIGTYHPAGLSERPQPAGMGSVDPDLFLTQGTLLVEFRHEPDAKRRNILRYAARDPWPTSLTICLDPDGTLSLLQGQAERSSYATVAIGPLPPGAVVQVSYCWDGPLRRGLLAVRLPDLGVVRFTEITDPLPLCHRDVRALVEAGAPVQVQPEVSYVAVSDVVEPIGPGATFGHGAALDTPEGLLPVDRIRPGQIVNTMDGDTAQVRWIGSQVLPARGRNAPLQMRQPYFGLTHDLLVASDQRLRLVGSKVEYLFGQEEVCASVLHLADGRSIRPAPRRLTQRYYQIVLDRHTILPVNGAAMESFDPQLVSRDPELLRHSILRDMPRELLPRGRSLAIQILRDYEAVTLAR